MKIFEKIKSELDEMIDRDKKEGEKDSKNKKLKFPKCLIDFGSFLTHSEFLKYLPLILLCYLVTFIYMWNVFDYETEIRKNENLKHEIRLKDAELLKIETDLSNLNIRSELLKKLAKKGMSDIKEANRPPVLVK
jgi:hypothetical protein